MINDPFHPEEALEREKETTRSRLFGVVCAVAITALLLVGYASIKRFYSQRSLANQAPTQITDKGPKGPPVAHILIDQPSLEKGMGIKPDQTNRFLFLLVERSNACE